MSISNFILKKLASRYKMQDAYTYLQLLKKIGRPSEVDLPPDLFPMAGKMFLRAGANQMVFQISPDWVLPFWAQRQYTPGDPSFIPRMGWASMNITHRNWTAVGNLGSDREATIDPRGLITPWHEGWSLDFWMIIDGEKVFPSQMAEGAVTQKNVDRLPIIQTIIKTSDVTLTIEALGGMAAKRDAVYLLAKLINTSNEAKRVRFFISLRPYNPEGLYPVHRIEFTDQNIFTIDKKSGVMIKTPPDGVFCCDFRTGDCSHFIDEYGDTRKVDCKVGLATAFAEYKLAIAPGESIFKNFAAYTRAKNHSRKSYKNLRPTIFDTDKIKLEATGKWKEKLGQGLKIDVPDKTLMKAFDINKCYLNLFDDGASITPGVAIYHHYWFRDSAYMVAALDKMGYPDQAREKLMSYPGRQRSDGFFLSQDGEWDSAGQAIWTLVEHYRMTGDRDFLAKMYGSISKGAGWIRKKTSLTKDAPSPHYGLLPPGFSAEHFGPNDYFYWDDFWALAGLRDAAFSARVLGRRVDQLKFLDYFNDLNQNILASLAHVEKRLGARIMPTSPYRRFDSAAIGTTCVIHPLKLMDPHFDLVKNTTEALLEKCFIDNGFFQEMIHSGINVYLSFHVAQVLLAVGDQKAWDIADKMLELASDTYTWPEAVNLNTGGGAMGDGMHGWATGDFLLFVRNALINEEKNALIITPCAPKSWYDWGKSFKVENGQTHFGPVSFTVEGRQKEIILTLDGTWRAAPEKIIWNTPFDAKTYTVDGVRTENKNGRITFVSNSRKIIIGRSN